MQISLITPEQTYPLRLQVLRPGKSIDSVFLDKDGDPDSFHLGTILNGKIISVGSFHPTAHPFFNEGRQYQLRKMATSPDFRNIGAGKGLILKGIEELNKRKVSLLWCNAREEAIGFYEKIGFKTIADYFEVSGIGLHKVMFLKLFQV